MTKNFKILSKSLLSKFCDIKGDQVEGKIIPPSDVEAEKEALKNLEPGEIFSSSSGACCLSYKYQQKSYLAISIYLCESSIDDLERESHGEVCLFSPPDSHYLYLADRLNLISIREDSAWVEEHIVGPAQGDGVELEVLIKSLTAVSIFELSLNASAPRSLPYLYIANYICTFETNLCNSTRIGHDAIDVMRELFLREKMHFFGRNLFHALGASSLSHAFLEVYRLFEFTFSLPRADDLVRELKAKGVKVDLALVDFAKHCSEKLGWRMIERDSIKRIFMDHAADELDVFRDLVVNCRPFKEISPVPDSNINTEAINSFAKKVAEKYYHIRNQVVHQFWLETEEECNNDGWNALILCSLKFVRRLYEKHLTADPAAGADLGLSEADEVSLVLS